MRVEERRFPAQAVSAAGALILWLALHCGAAQAQSQTYVMKITLPTLHDTLHQVALNWAAAIEKDSGGRIKPQVYPASQLGSISRQIEGTQFGSIQAAIIPPEFFVGVDQRFEVMAAPGLIDSMEQGQRLAKDPEVLKLMLGLGANKGLHGVGLFIATPSSIICRTPIRHIGDFKGKKIRIFASKFQSVAFERLGITPVAMTLGDVLPAIQQGAIDCADAALNVYVPFHYVDAAKYVTETNQPAIFSIMEVSQKWFDTLPKDLQEIVVKDAASESVAINPWALDFRHKMQKDWVAQGGELISLPPDEQAAMMKTLSSVGEDVSKSDPALHAAYETVVAAAKRAAQAPSQ
ncbi:MAG TPA: TRAP transporter substrate-binding protein [Xanthobacteraceae bacterium]|nr:TRAP transporter substrate-binding protein [Xanthobacteraceae bacterium]